MLTVEHQLISSCQETLLLLDACPLCFLLSSLFVMLQNLCVIPVQRSVFVFCWTSSKMDVIEFRYSINMVEEKGDVDGWWMKLPLLVLLFHHCSDCQLFKLYHPFSVVVINVLSLWQQLTTSYWLMYQYVKNITLLLFLIRLTIMILSTSVPTMYLQCTFTWNHSKSRYSLQLTRSHFIKSATPECRSGIFLHASLTVLF